MEDSPAMKFRPIVGGSVPTTLIYALAVPKLTLSSNLGLEGMLNSLPSGSVGLCWDGLLLVLGMNDSGNNLFNSTQPQSQQKVRNKKIKLH